MPRLNFLGRPKVGVHYMPDCQLIGLQWSLVGLSPDKKGLKQSLESKHCFTMT